MNNSTLTVSSSEAEYEVDMFADLEPLSAFEVKRDYVATQLAALMLHCGKSRSDISEELGWKKSRVTQVLSGKKNLTLKTICEFSTHLGCDFDVVFHGINQPALKQPWQIGSLDSTYFSAEKLKTITLPTKAQSAFEVVIDVLQGKGKEFYYGATSEELMPESFLKLESIQTKYVPTEFNISTMTILR